VTLSEAYQYVFSHTLAATSATGVRQHPGYEYRLAGKGELVLTEVAQPSASLELPANFERALIVLVRRDQVLAELTSDAARRVALAPGEYAVRVWKGTRAYAARVTVVAGDAKKVTWSDLQAVSSPAVAGKGHVDELQPEGVDALTPEAKAEYLAKYVTVGDVLEITISNRVAQVENTYALYQGKYRQKLDEGAFYRLAGRADLAKSYGTRSAIKGVMFLGGFAVSVGAIVYAVASGAKKCDVPVSDCLSPDRFIAPMAVAGGGFLTALLSFAVNEHPVGPHEVRRLAEEYNTSLLRKLEGAPERPAQLAVRFDLVPSPSGGGLLLSGAF
jgi:hypothetical protein